MTRSYNLIDEPWLPVRYHDGTLQYLGLRKVFEDACEISDIAETLPTSFIAEHRLLLAILNRALSDSSWVTKDRANWFKNGLPLDRIMEYLDKWHDRFWFFDDEFPFMQVAALSDAKEIKKNSPWTKVDLTAACGNAPVLFDHSLDDEPRRADCSEVIRAMLGFLQFTPGGLVKVFKSSDKIGALGNTAAILPIGNNLNETLALCLHPYKNNDLPSWEKEALKISNLTGAPVIATGHNDRYTRQTRSLLFIPESDGTIRYMRFGAGYSLETDEHSMDYMASYKPGSQNNSVRLSFTEGRAIWRDFTALFPGISDAIPAPIIGNASLLCRELRKTGIELVVAGLTSDQAKLLRWRIERFKLSQDVLDNEETAQAIQEMLTMAEDVYSQLLKFAKRAVASQMPGGVNNDTLKVAQTIVSKGPIPQLFFSNLERYFLQSLNEDLNELAWHIELKNAALNCWKLLSSQQGNGTVALKAIANVTPTFLWTLKSKLPEAFESKKEVA